jgi:hypothetical protein
LESLTLDAAAAVRVQSGAALHLNAFDFPHRGITSTISDPGGASRSPRWVRLVGPSGALLAVAELVPERASGNAGGSDAEILVQPRVVL